SGLAGLDPVHGGPVRESPPNRQRNRAKVSATLRYRQRARMFSGVRLCCVRTQFAGANTHLKYSTTARTGAAPNAKPIIVRQLLHRRRMATATLYARATDTSRSKPSFLVQAANAALVPARTARPELWGRCSYNANKANVVTRKYANGISAI